jgi:hypothetical protein
MIPATITLGISTQGLGFDDGFTISYAMGIEPVDTILSAGIVSTDWVKTDADTAAGTVATGEGSTDGTYDVFWATGRRYGVTIDFTADAFTAEGGTGDDFPANDTEVILAPQVTIPENFDGNDIELFAAKMWQKGLLLFMESDVVILAWDLTAERTRYWFTGMPTFEIAGHTIDEIIVSNGSDEDAVFRMAGLQDAIG